MWCVLLLQSLLCDPNPNSPANSEAARLYNENKYVHNSIHRSSIAGSIKPGQALYHQQQRLQLIASNVSLY